MAELAINKELDFNEIEQAAIVLLSMGEERASIVLAQLEKEELLKVTQAMADMKGVSVETMQKVLARFFGDYRDQSGVRGASRTFLQKSLTMALGSEAASLVLNNVYGDNIRSKMTKLQWVSPSWLADHIVHEHIQVQAMFLVFLPPSLAGQVIDLLPEDSRDLILITIARLNEVEHHVLLELEQLLELCLVNIEQQGTKVEGVRAAADIIHHLSKNRDEMMDMLRSLDPGIVTEIEASMYDFSLLALQSDEVLTLIFEQMPIEEWAIAVKGCSAELHSALTRAMPRRQVQSFEDAVRRSGPVPMSRVNQLRRELMEKVKAMVGSGEIEFVLGNEEVLA
ncbi:FliG C-terminal domain-containing protein [Chromobacterium haemolyticum]|uniref:FliG C-terminal domain-containing protein n=1 Tax=Chromobacterium haemolyticum TaxID=394935 RepID=UPI0009D9C228|nr:FliG C-terminal domain-containing protein [Chromobacterium haemolyticum]OQS33880.1 flagellar motor switch protein FliG [Chromobacterium haemolyticum]